MNKLLLFQIAEAVHTKGIGRMANDTDWEWSLVAVGSTVESGRKDSKAGTVSDSRLHRLPNTTEPGLTDCRTVTDQRPTPMEVLYMLHYYN